MRTDIFPIQTLLKSSIGFSDLFREIELASRNSFPKYNIYKKDSSFFIELALAGYKKEDVNIIFKDGKLTISSDKIESKNQEDNLEYVCKGIASRSFSLTFPVQSTWLIKKASMEDGILLIEIEEDKEKLKSLTIDIE